MSQGPAIVRLSKLSLTTSTTIDDEVDRENSRNFKDLNNLYNLTHLFRLFVIFSCHSNRHTNRWIGVPKIRECFRALGVTIRLVRLIRLTKAFPTNQLRRATCIRRLFAMERDRGQVGCGHLMP